MNQAREVRAIIVWLLRSKGYRALAATDRPIIQSLLSRRNPVLVVDVTPTPCFEGWNLLAFCHPGRAHVPVLIASGDAFDRWPEVKGWASGIPRQPFNAAQFRTEIQRLSEYGAMRW